jgi:hypothetical protein
MAAIKGPGCIRHIWLTTSPDKWRELIFRMYWDGEAAPSVEAPLGDFFCNGWCEQSLVNAMPIQVNPAGGMNCFFPMPFHDFARITVENIGSSEAVLYYQVDYSLGKTADRAAYFHARWNRSNPVQGGIHTLVEEIHGKGQYVGTYMAIQVNNNGWWGEGEVKFYMDGDREYPTICTTGTEDYFGGAWDFEQPKGTYGTFSTPFMGLTQVIRPDGLYRANTRFGMYRFHILDPIRFEKDLKVTIQDLGWRRDGRYLVQQNDISTVSYWYQDEPHSIFPSIGSREFLEVI